MRVIRSSFVALALTILLVVPAPLAIAASPAPESVSLRQTLTAAQDDDSLEGAAEAAREFSRLESARDFDALYELMHPDSRAVVPRSAVVGWYEAFYADRTTAELTVNGVVAEPWLWGVTGTVYDDAVTVSYTQPYWVDGVRSDVDGAVHLVHSGDGWGWFFGSSAAFVDQQIALYGDDGSSTVNALAQPAADDAPTPTDVVFPDPLHEHIELFWEARFQEAGRSYDPPDGVVPFDAPIVTACGRADPDEEAAFYCVIDQKIYYSTDFRSLIERQIGDFAWVIVVAHEWGHHIQAILGFDLGVVPDRAGEVAPIALEQQADCLAGAYAVDAEITGWLDPGDIEEALRITEISGDPPGTAWNDPRAHGSGQERIDAFLDGYAGGIPACGLDLDAAAPDG